MDSTNGSWLPVKSVNSMSLEVKNLVEGRAYKFLVRAVNQIGDSPDLETENEIIAKNPFDLPSAPGKMLDLVLDLKGALLGISIQGTTLVLTR